MKRLSLWLVALLAVLLSTAKLQADDEEQHAWITFLGDSYGYSRPALLSYETRLGNWQDVATALFLAHLSGAKPEVVVGWRVGGKPWVSIATRLDVPQNALYLPDEEDEQGEVVVVRRHGPPYGRAWGYWYRSAHARRPNTVIVSDTDFRNRVLLNETSSFFGVPEGVIMQRVATGTPFTRIVVDEEGRRHHIPPGQLKKRHEKHGKGKHEGHEGEED